MTSTAPYYIKVECSDITEALNHAQTMHTTLSNDLFINVAHTIYSTPDSKYFIIYHITKKYESN